MSEPELVSAASDGASIELTYDLELDGGSVPAAGQFTVNVVDGDGTEGTVGVSGVSVSGKVVTLGLASALAEGQTVSVDYAYDDQDDDHAPLQRAGGGDPVPGFTGQAVELTVIEPRLVNKGYRGQLADVLVELTRLTRATAQAPLGRGPVAQSSHTASIVYVIDDSGSMDGDFPEVRDALEAVRDEAMADTKVALIAFGTNTTTLFALTDHSSDTSTGPWTEARINSFGGKLGGTYYEAPLQTAKALLDADTASTTKKIIFLTDAQVPRPTDVVQDIIDANIIVDTIGFGDQYADNFSVIEAIATDTGGAHRTVAKPSQGTTNDPAVTAESMTDILKSKVADNTATLFLVDSSFSVYWRNEPALYPALSAAAEKAGDSAGAGRQVGLAAFLGETTLFADADTTPRWQKYQVVNSVGSASLSRAHSASYSTGSTDIDHALQQAYTTISAVTATNKRVVLITDGISAAEVQDSTLDSYKNDTATTLDVVAWGEHADRVQLKTWAASATGTFSVAKAGPAQPRNLVSMSGEGHIFLSWDDPSDSAITRYQYRTSPYYRQKMSAWMDVPGSGAGTTWHIFPVSNGTQHILQLRALRGDTLGLTATVFDDASDFGIGLTATAGNGEIALTWSDPSDSTITKYQYTQRSGDAAWAAWADISGSDATTTSHTITGLTNGTEYFIALRAVTGTNTYGPVAAVKATPSS